MPDSVDVTILLNRIGSGDATAPEELLPLVYNELKRLASGYMGNERDGHTLQTTALVHEAYIRLVDWKSAGWQNRAHFFAVAAQMMRKILIDHARKHAAEKRGSGVKMIALDDAVSFATERDINLFALDEALTRLARLDKRQAGIVELKFFAGLSIEDIAETLQISPATVKREWNSAKAWLHSEITK